MKPPHVIEILVSRGGENSATPPRRVGTADLNAWQEHILEAHVGVLYTLTHDVNLFKSTKLGIMKGVLKKIAHTQVIR